MHKWRIKKRSIWLCNACMRRLTDVIMLGTWDWIDEVKDSTICCDRCKCNDITAAKFGRFRSIARFFVQPNLNTNSKTKAYRRTLY